MREFSLSTGRLELYYRCIPMGGDICVVITGGAAHLGAVSVGRERRERLSWCRSGHRDEDVSLLTAQKLGNAGIVCVVVCGIHYDDITLGEISAVMELASEGAEKLVNLCNMERLLEGGTDDKAGKRNPGNSTQTDEVDS